MLQCFSASVFRLNMLNVPNTEHSKKRVQFIVVYDLIYVVTRITYYLVLYMLLYYIYVRGTRVLVQSYSRTVNT